MPIRAAIAAVACAAAAVSSASAGTPGPAPCAGLVAEWRFDGDALDTSGLANHGTLIDGAFTPGVAGQALALNGTSTYANFGNDASLNPPAAITLSAWYRPVAFSGSGNDSIIDKGAASHSPPYYQYHLGVAGSNYPNGAGSCGYNVYTSNGLTGGGTDSGFLRNGLWCHLVGSYDGARSKFYANGVLLTDVPATGTLPDLGKPVLVGKFNNLNFYLPGTVDEVRIFNRGLSADEVDLLYRSPDARPMVIPPASNACPGGSFTFTVRHLDATGVTYQWRRNGQDLNGETGPTLTLTSLSPADATSYDCVVTTPCRTETSRPGVLTLCQGDINADGARNTADLTLLLATFGQSVPACTGGDLNSDGQVNTADLTLLLARFGQNCL